MAEFNPQINDLKAPNYTRGYSEPIHDLKADTSTGLLLNTVGEGIEGAAKLATQESHRIIDKDVRSTLEPIRSEFTADLQQAKASLIPGAVQTAQGPSLSGGDASGPSVPTAIKNGISTVESIQSAFVNGKINDTYYHQRLDTAVQSLRTKYPGFVDYIDDQTSKIVGVNPANAVVGDLMQDINRAMTNKKTEADKILDLARGAMSKGFENADAMYKRLQADPSFEPKFTRWYTEENARFTRLELAAKQRADRTGTRDELKVDDEQRFTNIAGERVASRFNSFITLTGMEKGDTISNLLAKARDNPKAFTGPQYEELAARLEAQVAVVKTGLNQDSHNEKYVQSIGVAKRDEIVKSVTDAAYQPVIDAIKKGNTGLAMFYMNQARARLDQTRDNLTSGPLGEDLMNVKIIEEHFGQAFSGVVAQELVNSKIASRLRPLLNQKKQSAIAQANPDNPVAITDHMNEAQADKRLSDTEKGQLFKEYINTVELLKNPQTPDNAKSNVIQYMFGPKSNSILQNFKMDYTTTDPSGRLTRVFHPGKSAVWTQMTDPAITDNVAKLAKTGDTKSVAMYKNWVDVTGREVIGEDVRNLNHFTGHDNLYFHYDSESKQLQLKDKAGALAPPTQSLPSGRLSANAPMDPSYVWQVQKVVDRINAGLTNLRHVHESFGGDTDTLLLQTLQQYGLDFNGKVTGLSKAMGDAIAASRGPQEQINRRFKGETK